MKKFMTLFVGEKPTKEQMEAGSAMWEEWMKTNMSSVSDMGGAFVGAKKIIGTEVSEVEHDSSMPMPMGYMMIKAENMDAAIEIMKTSPAATNGKTIKIVAVMGWDDCKDGHECEDKEC